MNRDERTCAWCHGSMEGRRKDAVTCRDACRQAYHRAGGRYVITPEDRAAIDKVSAADRLPDYYFTGQTMRVIRGDGEEG